MTIKQARMRLKFSGYGLGAMPEGVWRLHEVECPRKDVHCWLFVDPEAAVVFAESRMARAESCCEGCEER